MPSFDLGQNDPRPLGGGTGRWGIAIGTAAGIAVLSALPFLPLAGGVPEAHDLPDHVAMASEFQAGLAEGTIYPRWYGRFNFGWGEPTGLYYPPGLYLLTALATKAAGGDVLDGLFAALAVLTLVGMAGIHRLVRPVAGRLPALLACALYAVAPYRAFEIHAAGLYSAYAAGCLLPWALLALWKIAASREGEGRGDPIRPTLAWALSYCLIVLTNLPCALMMAYLVAIWALVESVSSADWRLGARAAAGGAWGALMAAVFLLPGVLELSSVSPPIAGGEDTFRSNFVFQQSGSWMTPGLSSLFTRMGAFPLFLALAAAAVLLWRGKARPDAGADRAPPDSAKAWLRLLLVFGGSSIFLSTSISSPVWQYLPFLHRVYMPWRFLDPFALAAAALGGAAAGRLLRAPNKINFRSRRSTLTWFKGIARNRYQGGPALQVPRMRGPAAAASRSAERAPTRFREGPGPSRYGLVRLVVAPCIRLAGARGHPETPAFGGPSGPTRKLILLGALTARGPFPLFARLCGLGVLASLAILCVLLSSSISEMNGKLPGKPTAALVESFCRRTGYFLPRGAMEPEKLEKHPLIEVQTPGTEVEVLRWSSSRRLLRVTSQVPARLALRTYYFPGWTARVDGEDAPLCLGPEPPAGRILLDLPAGRHEALVTFENTAVRSLGVLVSALAIAGWAMALVLVSRKTVEGGREPSEAWRPEVPQEALRV